MYIEFTLPNGSAGQAASNAINVIEGFVNVWSTKHNIPYYAKVGAPYKFHVFLGEKENYTIFALTWETNPKYPSWTKPTIVDKTL